MSPLIARCEYTMTRELSEAGSLALWRDSNGAFTKKALLALGGLWLLLAAVTLLLKQNPLYLAGEAVVLSLMGFWFTWYLPRQRARRGWRRLTERYGAELDRSVCFYEDRLSVEIPGREPLRIDYEDVRKALRSQKLLILVTYDQTGVLAPPDSFTLGGPEAVLDQLNKVCESE